MSNDASTSAGTRTDTSMCLASAKHIALVPAAGIGQRFGAALPKQYSLLNGRSMLAHTVAGLLEFSVFDAVCVVVCPSDTLAQVALAALACPRLHISYVGGSSRVLTVSQALAHLEALGALPDAWVWVHDAARPGFTRPALDRLHAALQHGQAAILALPVADTVKRVATVNGFIHSAGTLDRSQLWLAQTPQVAQLGVLSRALSKAVAQSEVLTDEASALELSDITVHVVEGSCGNFKVTTPEDAVMMEYTMQVTPLGLTSGSAEWAAPNPRTRHSALRVGEGMDVHALVPGRPLVLGGVTVPHTHGLLGHSDADALCHALTDALLGAAGLGDIGRMFPDTDAHYAGADSTLLLSQAYAAVRAAGWRLVNADATIIAQSPKLASYMPAMQARLAQVLHCEAAQLNVKAKTNESLGFLGRKEGIECRVTVLLEEA